MSKVPQGSREPGTVGICSFTVALFVVGFVLRWLFVDGDFGGGDEAWYLYLARGFGREPGVQGEHPWFHIASRPLFYAFYHASTYAGLHGFRLTGCFVGACLPVLAFHAARKLGTSFFSAAISATFLAFQAQQLKYSASVFPDALAAAFALAALWAVAVRAHELVLLTSVCCVASKESFVLVPTLIVLLDVIERRKRGEPLRLNRWQWLTLALPAGYVGLITAINLATPSLRLQGWSSTPFTLGHARNMWVGPELWPLLAWLFWRRQTRTLILWLGMPLFYLAWNHLLGRGLAPWYVVGPAALSSVAAALAIDFIWMELRSRGAARWTRYAILAVCLCFFAPVPLYGLTRVRAQLVKLDGRLPEPDAADEVRSLITRRSPEKLLLVGCFWAYRYTHLRAAEPAAAVWWENVRDTEPVLAAARAASMVVLCRSSGHAAIEQELRRRASLDILYEDDRYLVLAHRR